MKKVHNPDIIRIAKKTINLEVNALCKLHSTIDDAFVEAVRLIANCSGRILITGVGKSAIVGRKIVATFNSINVPSIFLHAADALHGDLGSLQSQDVVICLSKSGNTSEIQTLINQIKTRQNSIIAIVANPDSVLAHLADVVIITPVEQEADPFDLAPTVSTMVQMAVGDALAVCLMEIKSFQPNDFAQLHPGGMLGKRLNLLVKDLIHQHEVPSIFEEDPIEKVIVEISSKRLGATAVLGQDGSIKGIITDGDLRRMLQRDGDYRQNLAKDVMTHAPKLIRAELKAIEALDNMRRFNITQLLVTNDLGHYIGVVHIHDLLREGF